MIRKINKNIYKEYAIQYGFFAGAILEVTSVCNFSCVHCYNTIEKRNTSFENIKLITNKLEDMGIIYVTLTGGEALIAPEFEKIYLYLKRKGFIITIFTNMSLIKCHIELLRESKPFRISGSLYGLSDSEYFKFTKAKMMFENVKTGIEQIINNNIKLELKVIVTKMNYVDVLSEKYDRFAKKYDSDIMYDSHIFLTKNMEDIPLEFRISPIQAALVQKKYNQLSKEKILDMSPLPFFCENGNSYIYIDIYGEASVCMKDFRFRVSIYNKTEKIQNYIKNRALQIGQNAKIYKCNSCKNNVGCGWCPVEFEFDKKNIVEESFLCNVRQEFMKMEK